MIFGWFACLRPGMPRPLPAGHISAQTYGRCSQDCIGSGTSVNKRADGAAIIRFSNDYARFRDFLFSHCTDIFEFCDYYFRSANVNVGSFAQ